jgi:hypothetical protein
MTVGAILPWATTTDSAGASSTRWGLAAGRGVPAVVIGLAAIFLGVIALRGRRFGGNRFYLVVIGLLAIVLVVLERSLIIQHLNSLRFNLGNQRNLTPAQVAAQQPHNSYGIGLWMIGLGGVVAIVAGALFPKQIMPKRAHSVSASSTD